MKKLMKSVILLAIFFVILSERVNMEVVILGIAISLGVSFFNREELVSSKNKTLLHPKKIYHYIIYFLVLCKEIIVANIQVAWIVLNPSMDISPKVVRYKTQLKSKLYQSILANSITLTPGTLTMDLKDSVLTIHCLRNSDITGIKDSKFEQILLKIEEIDYDN